MKVYNTLTRTKEEVVPLTPGEIKMYSCGVTVYDLAHVGHARMMIVFDVISRYLRFAGYRVTFVRNFTASRTDHPPARTRKACRRRRVRRT